MAFGRISQAHFQSMFWIDRHLEDGGNSRVFLGRRLIDSMQVVIKVIPLINVTWLSTPEGRQPSEVYAHRLLRNVTGIVNVIDSLFVDDTLILVMERLSNAVDLFTYVCENGFVSEHDAKHIISQVVRTCTEIHGSGLFHLDVKPENLLLDRSSREVSLA